MKSIYEFAGQINENRHQTDFHMCSHSFFLFMINPIRWNIGYYRNLHYDKPIFGSPSLCSPVCITYIPYG